MAHWLSRQPSPQQLRSDTVLTAAASWTQSQIEQHDCEIQPADTAHTLRPLMFPQAQPSYHIAPDSVIVCCDRVVRPPASQAAPASSQAAHGRPSQHQSPKSHLRSHGR